MSFANDDQKQIAECFAEIKKTIVRETASFRQAVERVQEECDILDNKFDGLKERRRTVLKKILEEENKFESKTRERVFTCLSSMTEGDVFTTLVAFREKSKTLCRLANQELFVTLNSDELLPLALGKSEVLRNLTQLDFQNCPEKLWKSENADSFIPFVLSHTCHNLIVLNLCSVPLSSLDAVLQCRKLQKLTLDFNEKIQFDGLKNCITLEEIDLRGVVYPFETRSLMRIPQIKSIHFDVHYFNILQDFVKMYFNEITGLEFEQQRTCTSWFSHLFKNTAPSLPEFSLNNVRKPQLCIRRRFVTANENDLGYLEEVPLMIEQIIVLHAGQIQSVSSLAEMQNLSHISLGESKIKEIGPLRGCIALEKVEIIGSAALKTLAPLAGLPNLKEIVVYECGIVELGPLHECPRLEVLKAFCCYYLQNLGPLAGAPNLRVIDVSRTSVEDLTPVRACPKLELLEICRCRKLRTLAPLAGAPSLKEINAFSAVVEELGALHDCLQLEMIKVDSCGSLRSLALLAGAPNLRKINASNSAIEELGPLHQCPKLEIISVEECKKLRTLAPLAGAPSLKEINAYSAAIEELGALHDCPQLQVVKLMSCNSLRSVASLAGAPNLKEINIAESCIEEISPLYKCAKLERFNGMFCKRIRSLSGLVGSPALKFLCISSFLYDDKSVKILLRSGVEQF